MRRIGSLVPPYMRRGAVIQVLTNAAGVDWLNEYKVNFGNHLIATFYESLNFGWLILSQGRTLDGRRFAGSVR